MKNRIFIVTGAMGHLGNTIVQELVSRSETIRALALPGDQSTSFDSPLVTVCYGDVRDRASLEPIMSVPEGYETYAVHAAGIVSHCLPLRRPRPTGQRGGNQKHEAEISSNT